MANMKEGERKKHRELYTEIDRVKTIAKNVKWVKNCSHHRLKWAYKLVVSNSIFDAWLSQLRWCSNSGKNNNFPHSLSIGCRRWWSFLVHPLLFYLFCDFFKFQLHYYLHIVCACACVYGQQKCYVHWFRWVNRAIILKRKFLDVVHFCFQTPPTKKTPNDRSLKRERDKRWTRAREKDHHFGELSM